jgi:predicted phosphodiesterase
MTDLSDFAKSHQEKSLRVFKKKNKHPEGFDPGIHFDGKKGTITSTPQESLNVEWKDQLQKYFGNDYKNYKVVEPAEIRSWDMVVGPNQIETLYYFKAKIVSNKHYMGDDDFKKLLKEIKRKKTIAKPDLKKGKSFVVACSDWQIGKKGTEKVVDRWIEGIDLIKSEIKTIRKTEPINKLVFAGLGDIVEGCSGWYDQQEFSTELDHRQQQKVARRMMVYAIKELLPMFDETLICFIGGNHGEFRQNKKSNTTFGDNKDVMLAEELYDIFKANPIYKDRIKFVIPENELSVTLEIDGVVCTLIHGHQARSGGTNAQAKAKKWLADQSLSRSGIADSDILLMGHYHFFSAFETSDRLIVQAPTLDNGSEWFENTSGDQSNPGILTMIIGGEKKWSHIRIIR